MEINTNVHRSWAADTSTLTKVCIGFASLILSVMFFEADLQRILTPFIEPFLLLLLAFVYLILVIISLVHIPLQFKKTSWRTFLPISCNVIIFLSIYYLFVPLSELRVDLDFFLKKNRLDKVAQWIDQSIQNGDLSFEYGKEETVFLPNEYQGLTDRDRVYVTQEYEGVRIFFSRGGGMFEYYPGYMYHSANISPPIKDGDIVCIRKIKPNWYDCY